jgi:hypothetical protein
MSRYDEVLTRLTNQVETMQRSGAYGRVAEEFFEMRERLAAAVSPDTLLLDEAEQLMGSTADHSDGINAYVEHVVDRAQRGLSGEF